MRGLLSQRPRWGSGYATFSTNREMELNGLLRPKTPRRIDRLQLVSTEQQSTCIINIIVLASDYRTLLVKLFPASKGSRHGHRQPHG